MLRPVALFCLSFLFCLSSMATAQDSSRVDPDLATPDENGEVLWYDAQQLTIEGQAWSDTKSPYDRLPPEAESTVREAVWNLSRHSAGIAVRFETDATTIRARWTLTSESLAMPHMPATGVSGLDLYVRDSEGTWRWLSCARPTAQSNNVALISGIPEGRREYMVYLPLYNGVSSVEIGVDRNRGVFTGPDRQPNQARPIVFYGTSITHGACASRPGMPHPAILGRRFDRPVINLGFSGNGRMETEVVEFIAEIDAACFVLDCLPNIVAADVLERTRACVDILREAHPETPIVLVEDRGYSDSFLVRSKAERNRTSREALRQVYDELVADGIGGVYYLEGDHLLGDDNEGTVDSSHPTDLGFMRQADAFATILAPLLNSDGSTGR